MLTKNPHQRHMQETAANGGESVLSKKKIKVLFQPKIKEHRNLAYAIICNDEQDIEVAKHNASIKINAMIEFIIPGGINNAPAYLSKELIRFLHSQERQGLQFKQYLTVEPLRVVK